MLAPVAWLVSSSFQSEAEITSVPPHWIPHQPTAENFAAIFKAKESGGHLREPQAGRHPATGGFIPSTAKNLLPAHVEQPGRRAGGGGAEPAGERAGGLCAGEDPLHRGRTTSIYFMLTSRVIPDIALVVPFFLFVQKLGLLDNLLSLIITYLAITVPFSIFILTGYFESLPDELDKAARVDGCSRLQTMTLVFLPLALPSLVAVVLFTFLTSWNEFLLALMFTQTPRRRPCRSWWRRSRRTSPSASRSSTPPACWRSSRR